VGFEHVQDCTFGVQPLWSSGHFSSIAWSDVAREEGIQENRISWGSAVRKVEIYYRTTDLQLNGIVFYDSNNLIILEAGATAIDDYNVSIHEVILKLG
jgi:hypothetical protein